MLISFIVILLINSLMVLISLNSLKGSYIFILILFEMFIMFILVFIFINLGLVSVNYFLLFFFKSSFFIFLLVSMMASSFEGGLFSCL